MRKGVIKMNFFKSKQQLLTAEHEALDEKFPDSKHDELLSALFGGLKKRKSKNMKKRRKYKK